MTGLAWWIVGVSVGGVALTLGLEKYLDRVSQRRLDNPSHGYVLALRGLVAPTKTKPFTRVGRVPESAALGSIAPTVWRSVTDD